MKPVTKRISFEDLFPKESSRIQRIKRWSKWKDMVADEPWAAEYWETDKCCCLGCCEYNKKDDWCEYASLPPSVNPILSFRFGMAGLACCGLKPGKNEMEMFL
jgi:hypothetical protein